MTNDEYDELIQEIKGLRRDINAIGLALYCKLTGEPLVHYQYNPNEYLIKEAKDLYDKDKSIFLISF